MAEENKIIIIPTDIIEKEITIKDKNKEEEKDENNYNVEPELLDAILKITDKLEELSTNIKSIKNQETPINSIIKSIDSFVNNIPLNNNTNIYYKSLEESFNKYFNNEMSLSKDSSIASKNTIVDNFIKNIKNKIENVGRNIYNTITAPIRLFNTVVDNVKSAYNIIKHPINTVKYIFGFGEENLGYDKKDNIDKFISKKQLSTNILNRTPIGVALKWYYNMVHKKSLITKSDINNNGGNNDTLGDSIEEGIGDMLSIIATEGIIKGFSKIFKGRIGSTIARGAGRLVKGAGGLIARGATGLARGAGGLIARGAGGLIARGAAGLAGLAAATNPYVLAAIVAAIVAAVIGFFTYKHFKANKLQKDIDEQEKKFKLEKESNTPPVKVSYFYDQSNSFESFDNFFKNKDIKRYKTMSTINKKELTISKMREDLELASLKNQEKTKENLEKFNDSLKENNNSISNSNIGGSGSGSKTFLASLGDIIKNLVKKVTGGGSKDTSTGTIPNNLTEAAYSIISANEGNYGSVSMNNNGHGVSLGKLQWISGRALGLLEDMMKVNPEKFTQIMGTDFVEGMKNKQQWNKGKRNFSPAEIQKFQTLMKNKEFQEVQDKKALQDTAMYIEHGKKMGITDPKALMMYADLYNQWGGNADKNFLKYGTDLESIRKATTESNAYKKNKWGFRGRNDIVYNKVMNIDLNKFNDKKAEIITNSEEKNKDQIIEQVKEDNKPQILYADNVYNNIENTNLSTQNITEIEKKENKPNIIQDNSNNKSKYEQLTKAYNNLKNSSISTLNNELFNLSDNVKKIQNETQKVNNNNINNQTENFIENYNINLNSEQTTMLDVSKAIMNNMFSYRIGGETV